MVDVTLPDLTKLFYAQGDGAMDVEVFRGQPSFSALGASGECVAIFEGCKVKPVNLGEGHENDLWIATERNDSNGLPMITARLVVTGAKVGPSTESGDQLLTGTLTVAELRDSMGLPSAGFNDENLAQLPMLVTLRSRKTSRRVVPQ